MGRERFHFLPFPRPVGSPFGILTYPDGRVGVIHRSAWNKNSPKFAVAISPAFPRPGTYRDAGEPTFGPQTRF
jgi:hypothetical protein